MARLLAWWLPRSVQLRGDVFRQMIIGGRAEMTPQPAPEAWHQLRLRYDLAAAGFTVVL